MRQALLTVLLAFLACSALAAEEPLLDDGETQITRLEFVAFEEERPTESKFRLEVGGGLGFPDMDALNDYVDHINQAWSGSVDHVDRYDQYRVGLEYLLKKNWYGGLAYERFHAETHGSLSVLGASHRYDLELDVDGAELYLKKVWPDVVESVDLHAVLGGGCYWSDYTEKENSFKVSGDDRAFGVRAGVGADWQITQHLDLFLQGGYRWLEFDRYQHSGHTVSFFSPGRPDAQADFSGFSVSGGIAWRF